MCGIAGIADQSGLSLAELCRMSQIMRHRGPDDEGVAAVMPGLNVVQYRTSDTASGQSHLEHVDAATDQRPILGLAHRRLSILDLSPSGHQPMLADGERYALTYNGEIYNFKELRDELRRLGHDFHSQTDTEVILRAYVQWGAACVDRFVGMWAFAIWDSERQQLFLSRDRFGIKPLYYAHSATRFAFASEIKALLELDSVSRQVNESLAIAYISHGSLPHTGKVLFDDVSELQAGENLLFDLRSGHLRRELYYDLAAAVSRRSRDANASSEDSLAVYQSMFDDSVRLHLRADVAVGSCLSGGLDSSLIVASAAERLGDARFNTFTAAYHDKEIDESGYARQVSDYFDHVVAHYTFPDPCQFWEDLESLVWHQDLPVASTSMYAQWCVMRRASEEDMKVLLDGQGADESLGGYSYYAGVYLLELLRAGRIREFIRSSRKIKENRSVNIWNEMGRALYHSLPLYLRQVILGRKRIGTEFLSTDIDLNSQDVAVPRRIGTTVKETNLLGIQFGLRNLLRYEDRNSMAFSIESRVPFLDHRLVEFGIALDNRCKIHDGWHKYVLRKAADGRLPAAVVWRQEKKGFVTPQRHWKNILKESLLEFLAGYDMPPQLSKKKMIHYTNMDVVDATNLSEYWRLVSFLKWLQVYKVSM